MPYQDSTGFISAYNAAMVSVPAAFQLLDKDGVVVNKKHFTVPPYGTELVQLKSLFPDSASFHRAGGVRVVYQGDHRSLIVNGGIEDAVKGFSAPLPIFNRSMMQADSPTPSQFSFASVGMMTGQPEKALGFPAGTRLEPYAICAT